MAPKKAYLLLNPKLRIKIYKPNKMVLLSTYHWLLLNGTLKELIYYIIQMIDEDYQTMSILLLDIVIIGIYHFGIVLKFNFVINSLSFTHFQF